MKKQISYKERDLITFDLENEMSLYLQAMAGGRVFNLKKDPSEQLTGEETIEDVLKMAIGTEKGAVAFYTSLKGFVPAEAGRKKAEDIIKQEMYHLAQFNQELETLEIAK